MKVWIGMSAVMLSVPLAGCLSPQPTSMHYQVLKLGGAPPDAVFDTVRAALADDYTVTRVDRRQGLVEAVSAEGARRGGGARLGDVMSLPRRERRVAEVRIQEVKEAVKVYCKVVVQEYDTGAHEMFRTEHAVDDLPSGTPADREAATTMEQNEVWRSAGRDRAEEDRLLRAIREQLGGARVL